MSNRPGWMPDAFTITMAWAAATGFPKDSLDIVTMKDAEPIRALIRAAVEKALAFGVEAELARLAADNAKLRACVKAADAMRVEARCEHENGNDPREKCCDACWTMIDYDAARAEVDKP